MTPVTVRDARPEDAAAIARIAHASWRDTYRDILEPAFIDAFLATNHGTGAPGAGSALLDELESRLDVDCDLTLRRSLRPTSGR